MGINGGIILSIHVYFPSGFKARHNTKFNIVQSTWQTLEGEEGEEDVGGADLPIPKTLLLR